MPLAATQLAALKTELNTDPRTYGYAADLASGNDSALVAKLNLPRDGTNGGPVIKVNNPSVDTGRIRAAVTFAAFDGLVTASRQWFDWLTANGFISVNAHLLQSLAGIPTATGSIWAAGDRTAMNAAMEGLMRRNGSRAEELFGVAVTDVDVAKAKALA